jgi:crossover junction endodeoxyribonuclease RuvC
LPSAVRFICGIDPGLGATGYAVLRMDDDDDTILVKDAGVLRCSPRESLPVRLAELAAGFDEVLNEHPVSLLAVEQVYSHYQHPRTAILMAHARGIFLLEAARRQIEVMNLPATTVKRHLTGNGRASKQQVQRAVAGTLRLGQIPEPPDVADALAIALCAANLANRASRPEHPGSGFHSLVARGLP